MAKKGSRSLYYVDDQLRFSCHDINSLLSGHIRLEAERCAFLHIAT